MNLTELGFESVTHIPPNEKEVAICLEWLKKNAVVRKTVNTAYSSYGWKHFVEHTENVYVTNGAFIKACIDYGLIISRITGTPNAHVNLSSKSVPDGYWK